MKVAGVVVCVVLLCGTVWAKEDVEVVVPEGSGVAEVPGLGVGYPQGHLPNDGVTLRPMKKVRRPISETREERRKRQDYYYYYYYYY
ncbi:hypothetical protein L596_018637 [Steinernema carpocapsae]|uniref:Uncharacterized protein n=1 Tax=Steinernema carpocapsae TaxID=34508 RepID=A0A4U5N580_STECR|nr:hypothetical protein L596_018637 [Steinernema carpocapsae]